MLKSKELQYIETARTEKATRYMVAKLGGFYKKLTGVELYDECLCSQLLRDTYKTKFYNFYDAR